MLAAPAAHAAGGGNSTAAQQCQKGGYLRYQAADGTRFTTADACTSDAARGGTLTPIPPTVGLSFTPTNDPGSCNVVVSVRNAQPSTTYTAEVVFDGFGTYDPSATTDSTGAVTTTVFSIVNGLLRSANVTVDGVTSAPEPLVCWVLTSPSRSRPTQHRRHTSWSSGR